MMTIATTMMTTATTMMTIATTMMTIATTMMTTATTMTMTAMKAGPMTIFRPTMKLISSQMDGNETLFYGT